MGGNTNLGTIWMRKTGVFVRYKFTDFVFDSDLRVNDKNSIAKVKAASMVI